MRERLHGLLRRFLKFCAVGWMGMGVQLATLTLLMSFSPFHYLAATALAVESAVLHNFLWHELWTWSDRTLSSSPGRTARLLRFNATTGLLSILGNVVFMRLFVGGLGLHYLASNLASIACCAAANFVISDRFVFFARGPLSRGEPLF